MLSKEDNELLTRIGPGTATGDVMRQYWMPILISNELPHPDCDPIRVRLLGEALIAFRDSKGRVGLLGEHCPHRGASLFFGRAENCYLQCVYHGWKFDVNGKCLETPNEPPESNLQSRVRATSYPCVERSGVIWAYLGKEAMPPQLPDLEWTLMPESNLHISKRVQQCNWAQALEGAIDSSHTAILHGLRSDKLYDGTERQGWLYALEDTHPRFEVEDTDYGLAIGARRNAAESSHYWRITQFLMPFYTMIPPYGPKPVLHGHAFVPIDDENTLVWTITWHPTRAVTPQDVLPETEHIKHLGGGLHVTEFLPATSEPAGAWKPAANKSNDYFLDRGEQRNSRVMGVPCVALQDAAVQESMGPIYDRRNENLGLADAGIVRFRRRFLLAARLLREEGKASVGVHSPGAYRVRAAAVVLPRDIKSFVDGARDWMVIRPGVHMDAA
jgi:phthalate 4,5-dioxygenase oxygenase subunit